MDWNLEVVVIPVFDVDRSKDFYAEKLGFNVDVDRVVGPERRVVQLTPPGSGCAITLMTQADTKMEPGSLSGVQLCVADVKAAWAELAERGVETSGVQVFEQGGPRPYREGDSLDMAGFVFFSDPDGNSWAIQQMPGRS
jgi:catechol 2,3-dioxygenase-like lactoylglutathione lyase family enzyme